MAKDLKKQILEEIYEDDLTKDVGKKKKEEENTDMEVTYLRTVDFVLEQVVSDTKSNVIKAIAGRAGRAGDVYDSRFLKFDLNTGTIEEVEKEIIEGRTYVPLKSDLFSDGNTLIFPSGVEEYESDAKLIKEIKNFVHYYLQVKEEEEWLIVYFVLLTWLADQFPFTAYLHFVGIPGSGKSRGVEVLSQLCYKVIQGSGSITVSSMFRLLNDYQGTLILNEFELGKEAADGYSEKMQILKAGSEDYVVFRVEGEGKKKVESFKLKGPKVLAGEHTIENAALESRMIVIPMATKTRKLPLYKTNKFKDEGEKLRKKLLLWRLKHINKINLEDFEFGVEELKAFDSRTQQVMTPLYLLAEDDVKKKILTYIQAKEIELQASRREDPAGKVFTTIYSLLVQKKSGEVVWEQVVTGHKEELTPRKLSNIVKKELGLQIIERGHNKEKFIFVDDGRYEKLEKYYFGSPETSSASPASPATGTAAGDTEELDVDKVLEELEKKG